MEYCQFWVILKQNITKTAIRRPFWPSFWILRCFHTKKIFTATDKNNFCFPLKLWIFPQLFFKIKFFALHIIIFSPYFRSPMIFACTVCSGPKIDTSLANSARITAHQGRQGTQNGQPKKHDTTMEKKWKKMAAFNYCPPHGGPAVKRGGGPLN